MVVVPTPGLARIMEIDAITGGTGRFAGAQRSFAVAIGNLANRFTSGSFQGPITPAGAAALSRHKEIAGLNSFPESR